MPATEYQGTSTPFPSFGRSILSTRREQVHAMDAGHHHDAGLEREIDAFQRRVAALFHDLAATASASASTGDDLLSLAWVRKLLDIFLVCQEEFRAVLFNHRAAGGRPPLDRMIADFFDRGVKALDVCNAIRDGIEQLRQWRKHLEIILVALADPRKQQRGPPGEGQFRRARKALTDLTLLMLDEKDAAGSVLSQRNRSFGRSSGSSSRDHHHHRRSSGGHFRSLSWSVSRSWSAARQLQAIGNNLAAPRGHEVVATGGLAVVIFTMSSVLLFVTWALVAAIPCQDRGLGIHFSIPRSYPWAAPILSLHESIVEESKKKERKNSSGLLKEIHQIENCAYHLTGLMDTIQFPMTEEKEAEVRLEMEELAQVCQSMDGALEPLERQVREVFHRIVRSRTESLDCLFHNPE